MRTWIKPGKLLLPAVSTVLLVLLDQFTKYTAQKQLRGRESIPIIRHVFELQYLENSGSAFGMMQGRKALFLVTAALMLILIPYIYFKIPTAKRFCYLRITAVLALSGAAGNAVDRILHGYVIDFFYFSLIDFPIFNVADIYLTTASVLLIFLILFYYKDEDFEQIHFLRKG